MSEKGLYLNGDPVSLPNGVTTFALNTELDDNASSYLNAKGFNPVIFDSIIENILTVCEMPDGFILAGRIAGDANRVVIEYYHEANGSLDKRKTINSSYIKSATVTAPSLVYTYNYKKEPILTIACTKDDDIFIINLWTFNTDLQENASYMSSKVLIPDVYFPIIKKKEILGSLFSGTYQAAIQFKLATGEYTDFSPLTPPIAISNDNTSDPSTPTNKGIGFEIIPAYLSDKYEFYRMAIIRISPTDRQSYITNEIQYNAASPLINLSITNLETYSTIPIESILVKTIPVIGAETATKSNNSLLLGNIKINTVDEDVLDTIALNTHHIFFKAVTKRFKERIFGVDEIYIFYLGVIDIKGRLVTTIPITTSNIENLNKVGSYGIQPCRTYLDIKSQTEAVDIEVNLDEFIRQCNTQGQVSGYVILMAEHNDTNSLVLSNAFAIRDGYRLCPDQDTTSYFYQHCSNTHIRIYPFEYLYNRVSTLNCAIRKIYSFTNNRGTFDLHRSISENPRDDGDHKVNLFEDGAHLSINDNKGTTISDSTNYLVNCVFTHPLNEGVHNIQGESHFKAEVPKGFMYWADNVRDKEIDPSDNNWVEYKNCFPIKSDGFSANEECGNLYMDRVFKVRMYNPLISTLSDQALINALYGDVTSQKLAIASPVIPNQINDTNFILTGDTYEGIIGVRIKSPGLHFSIMKAEGDDDINSKDTKTGTTNQIVVYGTMYSKYNIRAIYQEDADIDNFILKDSNVGKVVDWSNNNYVNDNNYGHTKGDIYSKAFNENGIDYYPIRSVIDKSKTSVITNRIIKSDVINTESLSLGWRHFRPTSYSDIDASKGDIIALSASDKELYIQCQYGLKINKLKDVLKLNDTESTYLGTGDLFDRASVEIMYSPIGYIGCSHKNHCYYSIFGYIVIDVLNHRIFCINEQGVNCLTDRGIAEWAKHNIIEGYEYNISVDQNNKILYIHKSNNNTKINDYDSLNENNRFETFTISYNFISGTFISFHSWIVDKAFNTSNYYIIPSQAGVAPILRQSSTQRGVYGYNGNDPIYSPTVIKMLFSEPKKGSQLLKSIIWDSKHYTSGNHIENKTFNSIFVHTATQASELLTIDVAKNNSNWWNSDKGANQKDLYEFNNFKDCARDRNVMAISNLLTGYTVKTDAIDASKVWFNKAAFINTYFFVVLNYTNYDSSNKLVINQIMNNTISNYR